MNTEQIESQLPHLEVEHELYSSTTICLSPDEIFNFFRAQGNVEKVLADLPKEIENFLDLSPLSVDQRSGETYEVAWQNKEESKYSGVLSLRFEKAAEARGTLITAQATFDAIDFKSDGPSTLINVFLRRMKALAETGEIATTWTADLPSEST
jgi:hypothetical protein